MIHPASHSRSFSSFHTPYHSLLQDRTPSAEATLLHLTSGARVGQADFYVTPIGLVLSLSLSGLPDTPSARIPYFPEIDGKRPRVASHGDLTSYRVRTACLPPVITENGQGHLTYATDVFRLPEILGRSFTLRHGHTPIARGNICEIR